MERELKRVFEQEGNEAYCAHGIALALCSEVHPRTHEAFGEGVVHRFGENLESDLEVWPDAKIVRYRNSSLAIALTNQEPPRDIVESGVGDGSVLFMNDSERFHTSLLLQSHGGGMVVFTPRVEVDRLNGGRALTPYGLEDQGTLVAPSVEPVDDRLGGGESASGRELAPVDPLSTSSTEPTNALIPKENSASKEKQPTIRVVGNLPHHPVVTKSHHGHPVIRFSIAEHPEPGETVYRKAYATKRFAEKIIDQNLQKGELIRVTGSEQTHPKMKNGKPVTQEGGEIVTERVIYAYGVKRVGESG